MYGLTFRLFIQDTDLVVGGGAPTPPKTLIQITRSEAYKHQRNVFSAPSMLHNKTFRIRNTISAQPSLAPSQVPNRVKVNNVVYHLPPPRDSSSTSKLPPPSSSLAQFKSTFSTTPNIPSVPITPVSRPASTSVDKPLSSSIEISPISPPLSNTRPLKSSNNIPKKDPMATLFIPKHRAHSQRPRSGTATQRPK